MKPKSTQTSGPNSLLTCRPIRVDHQALLSALKEQQETLTKGNPTAPAGDSSLHGFVQAIEQDSVRNSSYFGWVGLNEATATVAVTFRGTHGLDEWLKDVFIAPVPYPYAQGFGLVHAGFLIVYQSLRKSMQKVMESITRRQIQARSYLRAQSGAAVATLAGPDIVQAQAPT